jgi:GLPGLI family protein
MITLKKYILFFLLILWIIEAKAQEYTTIDTAQHLVYYKYSFLQDSTDASSYREQETVLQIGKKHSKFTDVNKIKTDSIVQTYSIEQMTQELIDDFALEIRKYKTSLLFNCTVYKNYPESNELTFTGNISKSAYLSKEPALSQWEYDQSGDTSIMDYSCKRAYINYAGRRYTAWYTPEIPIPDGPYKFSGLPGLILKVQSHCNEHVFEAFKISKPQSPLMKNMYFVHLDKYIETCPADYVKALNTQIQELFAMVANENNVEFFDAESKTRAMRKASSINNFIEKYN